MQKEELLTGLTLSDFNWSTALKKCKVCNESITDSHKMVFISRHDSDSTWICIYCESIYDALDNIIEIGLVDGYSEIKGIT